MNTSGTLYIVATPIGNLDDLSQRAIKTLHEVDIILAEDTRHSARLMHTIHCSTPLRAYHAHNEASALQSIISALHQGKNFALISDAGTPLICDPGFELVRRARQEGINVIPIPGACAFVTALCAAGIPCDTALFVGFLPAKSQARIKKLEELRQTGFTVICYESTHRIRECIEDVAQAFGEAYTFVLAKELTKNFEQFIHGNTATITQWFKEDAQREKGEFVLIFPALPANDRSDEDTKLLQILLQEIPLKQAVKIACQLSKTHKNELYQLALQLKG